MLWTLRHPLRATADVIDFQWRRRSLVPPRRFFFVGDGDFRSVGEEFLEHFRQVAGLHPDEAVLDVGSGIGRMAVPLTTYLSPNGSYEGFDVVARGIRWCQKNISSRYPNFHFSFMDVQNDLYNPMGTQAGTEVTFPYEDGRFDFAFATSVFTHMLPAEIERYVSEIARTIRSPGRALLTFFFVDSILPGGTEDGKGVITFSVPGDGYRARDSDCPHFGVAYEEDVIRRMLARHGLEIVALHRGGWAGHPGARSFQDMVVVRKGPWRLRIP